MKRTSLKIVGILTVVFALVLNLQLALQPKDTNYGLFLLAQTSTGTLDPTDPEVHAKLVTTQCSKDWYIIHNQGTDYEYTEYGTSNGFSGKCELATDNYYCTAVDQFSCNVV